MSTFSLLAAKAQKESEIVFASEIEKQNPAVCAFAGFEIIKSALESVGVDTSSDSDETVEAACFYAKSFRDHYNDLYVAKYFR